MKDRINQLNLDWRTKTNQICMHNTNRKTAKGESLLRRKPGSNLLLQYKLYNVNFYYLWDLKQQPKYMFNVE